MILTDIHCTFMIYLHIPYICIYIYNILYIYLCFIYIFTTYLLLLDLLWGNQCIKWKKCRNVNKLCTYIDLYIYVYTYIYIYTQFCIGALFTFLHFFHFMHGFPQNRSKNTPKNGINRPYALISPK